MAIAVVGTPVGSEYTSINAGARTVAIPSGSVGDQMFFIIVFAGTTAGTTWSTPSGWTEVLAPHQNSLVGSTFKAAIYSKTATTTTETSPSFTPSASARSAAWAIRMSGANIASTAISSAVENDAGAATQVNTPSLTHGLGGNTLYISFACQLGGGTTSGFTAGPSGYTFDDQGITNFTAGANAQHCSTAGAYKAVTTTSDDPGDWTHDNIDFENMGWTFAIAEAGGGGGGAFGSNVIHGPFERNRLVGITRDIVAPRKPKLLLPRHSGLILPNRRAA